MLRIASNDLKRGDMFAVEYPDGFSLGEVICVDWMADSVAVAFYDLVHNRADVKTFPFNFVLEVWNG